MNKVNENTEVNSVEKLVKKKISAPADIKKSPIRSSLKSIRVVFLGGLNQIGKNMTAIEYGEHILIIDCGTAFPDTTMLGIDLVIPDFSYL